MKSEILPRCAATSTHSFFVTLEGAYLRKDGATIEIRHEEETKLRVPLHNLDGNRS